jgi:hydroxypyruvate reductase
VGGGKAGAGMAAGVEAALGKALLREKKVSGWLNVPADCVQRLSHIHLHGARPAGKNEPTAEGVLGTERILEIVGSLGPRDLCVCLISGGGSALLPAPIAGLPLSEKLALTRFLSAAGANIVELNQVRTQLSRIKGGGLARACRAGALIALIISDVLGDPLDIIASGPTIPSTARAEDALAILAKYDPQREHVPANIYHLLTTATQNTSTPLQTTVIHEVIGNLAVAVDAAGIEAERRGYSHAMRVSTTPEPEAEHIGVQHMQLALQMQREPGPDCLITGGEPVVKLAPAENRGLGGRNQQLALAALQHWQEQASQQAGIVLLSGGTDGEDGPTDAAGAMIDAELLTLANQAGLSIQDYLHRNDAYHFFSQTAHLLRTGPTHTNVCDVRVIVVDRVEQRRA